jgi:hypothetical protein
MDVFALGIAKKRLNSKDSLFFSLLAGNSSSRDPFGGTASTTKQSGETEMVSDLPKFFDIPAG